MALDGAPTPGTHAKPHLVAQNKSYQRDDPIHGSAPGEIYSVQGTELLVVLLAIYLQATEQVLPPTMIRYMVQWLRVRNC